MATAYAYTTQHASAETSAEQLDTVTVVPSLQRHQVVSGPRQRDHCSSLQHALCMRKSKQPGTATGSGAGTLK